MISRVMSKSFILLLSDQTVGEVSLLLGESRTAFVVVARFRPEERYYLFTRAEFTSKLAMAGEDESVFNALELDCQAPTPVLEAYANEFDAPARAVIVDNGFVEGFICFNPSPEDSSSPPSYGLLELERLENREDTNQVERSVVTDFPSTVKMGEICSLLISLSSDVSFGTKAITAPLGSAVDIVVQARKGFELVGPREGSLAVTDEMETSPLQFKLKATREGEGIIRVHLFRLGQPLGSFEVESTIIAGDVQERHEPVLKQQHALPSVQVVEPDLSLIIIEQDGTTKPSLIFELQTREAICGSKVRHQFVSKPLDQNPQDYSLEFFQDIDKMDRKVTEQFLAGNGADLFEKLFPEPLRRELWSLKDRIHSIQIQSAEPWIPWELCRLCGWENGVKKYGKFLCEDYQVTRWVPYLATKTKLRLKNIALVVPQGTGLRRAEEEKNFFLSLNSENCHVELIPATSAGVRNAFTSGKYDAWHFACHGALDYDHPNHSLLRLEKGEYIMPVFLSGECSKLGVMQPLVFLNACQAGAATPSLSGAGGWADRFLKAYWDAENSPMSGAAAFIGAYWSIDDTSAHQFAVSFYTQLLNGKPIGEAAQKARLDIRAADDPTWLAYTVFAHPLAKVQQDIESAGGISS